MVFSAIGIIVKGVSVSSGPRASHMLDPAVQVLCINSEMCFHLGMDVSSSYHRHHSFCFIDHFCHIISECEV